VGGLVATALVGVAVSVVFQASVGDTGAVPFAVGESDPDLRAASVDSFRAAVLVSAGFMIAGALTAFFGLRETKLDAAVVAAAPEPASVEATSAPETLAYTWCDVDRCDRHESCRRARAARAAAPSA
jgi:hypothetical protein